MSIFFVDVISFNDLFLNIANLSCLFCFILLCASSSKILSPFLPSLSSITASLILSKSFMYCSKLYVYFCHTLVLNIKDSILRRSILFWFKLFMRCSEHFIAFTTNQNSCLSSFKTPLNIAVTFARPVYSLSPFWYIIWNFSSRDRLSDNLFICNIKFFLSI